MSQLSRRLMTLLFQSTGSLYQPTVPDTLDTWRLRQDGRRRGWEVRLAEQEEQEVGL